MEMTAIMPLITPALRQNLRELVSRHGAAGRPRIAEAQAGMKRFAIYARFSSDRQNEASIEDQLRVCRAYADRIGGTVVANYEDRASSGAHTAERHGYQRCSRTRRRSGSI